jgi:hypothetical protein
MIDRIVTSFNRDAAAWIAERDVAEAKLARIEALCTSGFTDSDVPFIERILRIIRGDHGPLG